MELKTGNSGASRILAARQAMSAENTSRRQRGSYQFNNTYDENNTSVISTGQRPETSPYANYRKPLATYATLGGYEGDSQISRFKKQQRSQSGAGSRTPSRARRNLKGHRFSSGSTGNYDIMNIANQREICDYEGVVGLNYYTRKDQMKTLLTKQILHAQTIRLLTAIDMDNQRAKIAKENQKALNSESLTSSPTADYNGGCCIYCQDLIDPTIQAGTRQRARTVKHTSQKFDFHLVSQLEKAKKHTRLLEEVLLSKTQAHHQVQLHRMNSSDIQTKKTLLSRSLMMISALKAKKFATFENIDNPIRQEIDAQLSKKVTKQVPLMQVRKDLSPGKQLNSKQAELKKRTEKFMAMKQCATLLKDFKAYQAQLVDSYQAKLERFAHNEQAKHDEEMTHLLDEKKQLTLEAYRLANLKKQSIKRREKGK